VAAHCVRRRPGFSDYNAERVNDFDTSGFGI